MNTGDETKDCRTLLRPLSIVVLTNAVLWALSIIALIFVVQRCPSAKGFFVIQASGLAAASAIVAIVLRQR